VFSDYHLHTNRCKHATGEMYEYVEKAIELGIPEIAFTDHIPLPDDFDIAHRMAYSELEIYLNQIEKMKSRYPEIIIKAGIEADYFVGFEDYLYKSFQQFNFDIVIMSVHFIKGWPKNNWVFSYYFPDRPIKDIYSDYLLAIKKGIETGLFDVLGHLDLIKSEDISILDYNETEVKSLLKSAKKHNMAIELNTSGMRKDVQEIYPTLDILPILMELELPITIGSDAHNPAHVGFYFNELDKQLSRYTKLNIVSIEQIKSWSKT